jgi:hypothetical protein
VIPQDVLLAAIVLVLLFGTILWLVYWARGAAPHDDGTGGVYRGYLTPADDDEQAEGWEAPPTRLPSKLPGDDERGRPKRPLADAARAGDRGDPVTDRDGGDAT